MKRLLLLVGLLAFVMWRSRALDAYDREHGFGAYAKVLPVVED